MKMDEIKLPATQDVLRGGISKLANELYIPVFARYGDYVSAKASFEENLYGLLYEQHRASFEKRVARRTKAAGFPYVKTMDTFSMAKERLPHLNFDEVRELATCKFVDEKADICAVGPSGHGKSHLALAVGYEAVRRGYSVKFRRACDLVNEMKEAKSEKHLNEYMRMMARCSLLIIDEIGYLDYDEMSANLLYQIVGARYETGSTFYTSNLRFSEWTQFAGPNSLTNAIVTRVAHQAIVLDMNGPMAWRLEHARSIRPKLGLDGMSANTSADPPGNGNGAVGANAEGDNAATAWPGV
jgi:DNA replication protein DnaC